jgi:hypothetical protein
MDLTDVEPGDLFVTATVLDPQARFPTGHGRIRHYDGSWRLKREIDTGRYGLISALHFDRTGTLHALDPQARHVDHFGPMQMPALPIRGYGSMIELPEGQYLLGEHLVGVTPGLEGQGKVYLVDGRGDIHATFDTETNGGVGGFLGVTHMALSADAKTLYHVSETGADVYAYDLAARTRRGVFYTCSDPPPMVFGLATLPEGDLLLAVGGAIRRLDGEGRVVRDYTMPAGRGWAVVILRERGASFWALDFFGGQLAIVDTASGDIRLHKQLGLEKALTGLAEVPAAWEARQP